MDITVSVSRQLSVILHWKKACTQHFKLCLSLVKLSPDEPEDILKLHFETFIRSLSQHFCPLQPKRNEKTKVLSEHNDNINTLAELFPLENDPHRSRKLLGLIELIVEATEEKKGDISCLTEDNSTNIGGRYPLDHNVHQHLLDVIYRIWKMSGAAIWCSALHLSGPVKFGMHLCTWYLALRLVSSLSSKSI